MIMLRNMIGPVVQQFKVYRSQYPWRLVKSSFQVANDVKYIRVQVFMLYYVWVFVSPHVDFFFMKVPFCFFNKAREYGANLRNSLAFTDGISKSVG